MGNHLDQEILLAKKIFTALNHRDLSCLGDLLDEQATFDFPGTGRIEGQKRIFAFFTLLLRQYPVLTFDVREVVANENRACVVWDNVGQRRDGISYHNSGITLIHFSKEKKIVFLSDFFKDTSFIRTKEVR